MSTVTRATAAGALAIAVALLAGCVAGPGVPQAQPTPAAFLEREALAACDPVTLGQGEEVPTDAVACLEEAGPAGAELAVTRPTVEGDPVTEYYRVLPSGGWEVYIDMTRDAYGGGWWLNTCPEATSMLDLGDCGSTEL